MKTGKKYLEKAPLVEKRPYSPGEAVALVKTLSYAKFDETVEVHINLGIDPRQSDQQVRGTLILPHGTGRKMKIAVITSGDKQASAKQAGADFVGGEDLVDQIQGGWLDFDLLITSPEMMAKVGKLGKTLGAKGLMPNPKSGTVTPNVAEAVTEFKAGKLEYKNDKAGSIHSVIGKVSFPEAALKENFKALFDAIVKAKPSKSKGVYIKSVTLCSTMSPGVLLEPVEAKWKEG